MRTYEQEHKELLGYVEQLKKAGYRVYLPHSGDSEERSKITYCIAENELGQLAYVEVGTFGVNISTKHKGHATCGTGYGIIYDGNFSLGKVKEACETIKPCWASSKDVVDKYKNFAEYISYRNGFNNLSDWGEV